MIIVARSPGQLGNQLFLFAHALAFAAEAGVPVANPAFARYGAWFPAFAGDPLCRWPAAPGWRPRGRRVRRAATGLASRGLPVARWLPGVDVVAVADDEAADLDDPALLARARSARALVLAGWELRGLRGLARHRQTVLQALAPDPRTEAAARSVSDRARGAGPLVGLHVRRGDYADYQGGRFDFGPQRYRAIAERALEAHGPGATLLVCSDQPLDPGVLDGLPATPGPGDVLGDLCALRACDTLIGPPSTFSMWASFSAGLPLQTLQAPDAPIGPQHTRIVAG